MCSGYAHCAPQDSPLRLEGDAQLVSTLSSTLRLQPELRYLA